MVVGLDWDRVHENSLWGFPVVLENRLVKFGLLLEMKLLFDVQESLGQLSLLLITFVIVVLAHIDLFFDVEIERALKVSNVLFCYFVTCDLNRSTRLRRLSLKS